MKMNENDMSLTSQDIKMPVVHPPSDEDLIDSALVQLKPQHQRFVHLYLGGAYTLPQIAKLQNVAYSTVRQWLQRDDIKKYIEQYQSEEDDIIRQGLKAVRMKALCKLGQLVDSNIDGIAYQAVRDILDRTGFKAPTKQEVNVEIKTFEQQILEIINNDRENYVEDVDFIEIK